MLSKCCPCIFSTIGKDEEEPQDSFQKQFSSRKGDSNLDDALDYAQVSISGSNLFVCGNHGLKEKILMILKKGMRKLNYSVTQ